MRPFSRVWNGPGVQAAFFDTPGIHRAEGALNRRMVEVALTTLQEVDAVLLESVDGRPHLAQAKPGSLCVTLDLAEHLKSGKAVRILRDVAKRYLDICADPAQREKRGLCYAIGARYHSLREAAGIACYAGTAPDKAQETYDVVLGEFQRLAEGINGACGREV